ncbi:unnamed protein product [Lactuca virosa]|uniref:F-box associated beta-propeller type 3 domain-containing protein n=1 Tax=Lactuca virosa TaxID=75947 RepID=A0AAU9N1B1_9ASTR|nr:unnamed protein product [Lactuca virosa]
MHTSRSSQKLLIRHQTHKDCGQNDFCTLHSGDQLPLCPGRGYIGTTQVKFPYNRDSKIIGSCNGILLLTDDKNRITLWNPSIRHTLTLPHYPRRCSLTGFGFDPITNNYKIVSICHPYSYVYAMKTRTWCPILSCPTPVFFGMSNACFVNGALHWVVKEFNKSEQTDLSCIMTFDLSTNLFGMIALPEPSWETARLTTIQGSLAVLSTRDGETWTWVRRDASWSVAFKTKIGQDLGGINRVLKLKANGDMLFSTWCTEFHSKVSIEKTHFQVYTHETGAQSKLVDFDGTFGIVGMEMCVQSIQLLGMRTSCEEKQPSFLEGKKTGEIMDVVIR